MTRRWLMIFWCSLIAGAVCAQETPTYKDIDQPPHNYRTRAPQDRFSRLKTALEAGKVALDYTSEKGFLLSLLRLLGVPATSQMLVFSTTSLQLSLITPANPRALFFNEDVYVGFIPGGKIEIVSVDPELGGVFYIFEIPKDGRPPRPERSERCMNCHAGDDTGHVPGLVVKSVVPGPTGGSLESFRREQVGHGVPFEQRFGGWYVTGKTGITNHWGNLIGRFSEGALLKIPNPPGVRFSYAKYPMASSDILPQLLHEHQAGFVNRVVQATYRARTDLSLNGGKLTADQNAELDLQARIITRYLLFADEVPLPVGGVEGEAAFKADFLRTRRMVPGGISLKDFDLRTRLFRQRCSYMIYSSAFAGLPPVMKQRVYARLREALSVEKPDKEFAYLPAGERQAIRSILKATLTDLPANW